MRAFVERILQGYGSLVTVQDGESARTFRAFVQPVTEKGWQNMQKVIRTLGQVPKGQFVYIGPAGAALSEGQTVQAFGEAFLVRRYETVYLADKALYDWALLQRAGGADPWNS